MRSTAFPPLFASVLLLPLLLLALLIPQHFTDGCVFASKGRKNPHLANIPNISLADIPSPLLDPMGCGRERSAPASMVCDPVKVFALEESDDIDSMILNTVIASGINVAVVIIHKMDATGYINVSDASNGYATALHERYNIGHLGMLLFLSMAEKQIVFHRHATLSEIITDVMCNEILGSIDSLLARDLFGEALEKAVFMVQRVTDSKAIKSKIMKAGPYLLPEIQSQVEDRINSADAASEAERVKRSAESKERSRLAAEDHTTADEDVETEAEVEGEGEGEAVSNKTHMEEGWDSTAQPTLPHDEI